MNKSLFDGREIEAADRTNLIWNAVQQGERIQSEEAETIEELELLALATTSRLAFQENLKEAIMSASVDSASPTKKRAIGSIPTWNVRLTRTASIAGGIATLVLVAVTLFGIVLVTHQYDLHGSGDEAVPIGVSSSIPANSRADGPNLNAGQVRPGSPTSAVASPTSCPASQSSYEFRNTVAVATFQGVISKEAASATNWQMQGWKIGAGATTEFSQPHPSVAVDFVLDGFYSAVFGSSASVSRHGEMGTGGGSLTVVKAGDTVDLTYGDAVSFDPSKGVKITNASHAIELDFKRSLFLLEGPNPTPSLINGAMIHIDASGTIPPVIGTIGAEETATIRLDYVVPSANLSCNSLGRLHAPAGAMTNPTGMAGNGYVITLGYNEG